MWRRVAQCQVARQTAPLLALSKPPSFSGAVHHGRPLLAALPGECSVGFQPMLARPFNARQLWTVANLMDRCPTKLQPYLKLARLDLPTGSLLLFLPCAWSIGMAALPGHFPDPLLLAKFGLGAVVMHGAGCTINDMWDRDIDAKVERTRIRPLACNAIGQKEAWAFLAAELSTGLAILLSLNSYSILLGAASMSLVTVYPLAKRVTWWPQLVLGLCFNWGALLGWAAVYGSCDWSVVLPLYAAGVNWTLVYDTIYAHQDKTDDRRVGVKSTALRFGNDTKKWLTGFGTATCGLLALAGHHAAMGVPYFATLAVAGTHMAHQIATVELDDPTSCMAKFIANGWFGVLVFAGIVADKLLAVV